MRAVFLIKLKFKSQNYCSHNVDILNLNNLLSITYRAGGLECIPSSILELWSYDYNQISNLTDEAILEKINTQGLLSPVTGRTITIERIIGGSLVKDQGRIVSASVLKVDYRLTKQDIFDTSKGRNVS